MADKSCDLTQRTFLFSCAIVEYCRALAAGGTVERHIASQLLKAGTSVGANAEEARAAFSRREFACKNALVLREARESLFWLRLVVACRLENQQSATALQEEANALVGIFTKTVKRAREPRRSFPSRNATTQVDGTQSES
jgi:four helix bundle protein